MLKDLGRFINLCSFRSKFLYKALCDLRARINLMPLSIYKKIGLEEVKPTTIKLQLADRSYMFSKGEIENILAQVDIFVFLVDFVILDMEADNDVI